MGCWGRAGCAGNSETGECWWLRAGARQRKPAHDPAREKPNDSVSGTGGRENREQKEWEWRKRMRGIGLWHPATECAPHVTRATLERAGQLTWRTRQTPWRVLSVVTPKTTRAVPPFAALSCWIGWHSFQSFQPSLNLHICSDSCLGNEGCLVVASALSRLPSLTKLYLQNNSLDDEGCLAVAQALTGLSTLEVLSSVSTSTGASIYFNFFKFLIFFYTIFFLILTGALPPRQRAAGPAAQAHGRRQEGADQGAAKAPRLFQAPQARWHRLPLAQGADRCWLKAIPYCADARLGNEGVDWL